MLIHPAGCAMGSSPILLNCSWIPGRERSGQPLPAVTPSCFFTQLVIVAASFYLQEQLLMVLYCVLEPVCSVKMWQVTSAEHSCFQHWSVLSLLEHLIAKAGENVELNTLNESEMVKELSMRDVYLLNCRTNATSNNPLTGENEACSLPISKKLHYLDKGHCHHQQENTNENRQRNFVRYYMSNPPPPPWKHSKDLP